LRLTSNGCCRRRAQPVLRARIGPTTTSRLGTTTRQLPRQNLCCARIGRGRPAGRPSLAPRVGRDATARLPRKLQTHSRAIVRPMLRPGLPGIREVVHGRRCRVFELVRRHRTPLSVSSCCRRRSMSLKPGRTNGSGRLSACSGMALQVCIQFPPAVHSHLREHRLEVVLDGVLGQPQLATDLFGRLAR
jgi:hypothetical protein